MVDRPSTSSSAPQVNPEPQTSSQLPRPASIEHALHARIDAFTPLCPSARTSYTRVDFTGTGANTPRRDFTGEVEGGDGEERDEDAGEQLAEEAIPQTPQVSLTFLLVSGRRRTMSFEPETTVGRVKELAWNTWPSGEHLCWLVPEALGAFTRAVEAPLTLPARRLARRAAACAVVPQDPLPRQDIAGRGLA